jgi:hypothetical protein
MSKNSLLESFENLKNLLSKFIQLTLNIISFNSNLIIATKVVCIKLLCKSLFGVNLCSLLLN